MVGTLGWVWVGHHHVARCLRRLMLEAIACIEQDLFFSGQKMSFPPAFLPSSSTQMRRRSLIRMSCSHRRAREPGGAISSDVGMATEKLWAATSENHGPQRKICLYPKGAYWIGNMFLCYWNLQHDFFFKLASDSSRAVAMMMPWTSLS